MSSLIGTYEGVGAAAAVQYISTRGISRRSTVIAPGELVGVGLGAGAAAVGDARPRQATLVTAATAVPLNAFPARPSVTGHPLFSVASLSNIVKLLLQGEEGNK